MVYCNQVIILLGILAIQHILSDWVYVQGSSVVKRKQHEYDAEKKHQKPQPCLPKCTVLI